MFHLPREGPSRMRAVSTRWMLQVSLESGEQGMGVTETWTVC